MSPGAMSRRLDPPAARWEVWKRCGVGPRGRSFGRWAYETPGPSSSILLPGCDVRGFPLRTLPALMCCPARSPNNRPVTHSPEPPNLTSKQTFSEVKSQVLLRSDRNLPNGKLLLCMMARNLNSRRPGAPRGLSWENSRRTPSTGAEEPEDLPPPSTSADPQCPESSSA